MGRSQIESDEEYEHLDLLLPCTCSGKIPGQQDKRSPDLCLPHAVESGLNRGCSRADECYRRKKKLISFLTNARNMLKEGSSIKDTWLTCILLQQNKTCTWSDRQLATCVC